jgi:hypothetical protein
VYSKKIGMALSVNYTDPKTAAKSTAVIFQNTQLFSNVTVPYCSHYTSESSFLARPSPGTFLTYLNFSNVYSNIQSALVKVNTLIFSNITFTPTTQLETFLGKLDTQVLQLGYIANCVTEKPDLTEKLFSEKNDLAISKERYNDTHSPETHVSNYEGTFPINRSLKTPTLFILFAAGIFLMLLAILIFMRMQGIELNLIMPDKMVLSGLPSVTSLPGATNAVSNTITSFFANNTSLVIFGCLVGVLSGYLYNTYYTQWTS